MLYGHLSRCDKSAEYYCAEFETRSSTGDGLSTTFSEADKSSGDPSDRRFRRVVVTTVLGPFYPVENP